MTTLTASISKGWFHQEGGFTFKEQYYTDPLYRLEQDRRMDAFVEERFPDYGIYNLESNLVQLKHRQPNQVLVGGIQPNLIISACLGGEFLFYPGYDADIEGAPLAGIQAVDELPPPAIFLDHPLIKTFDSQIRSLQADHPDLRVIPPFFWDTSGRATIHGFITTSFKLYGTDIFLQILQNPDFASELHAWITDVYILLIKHYSALADLPVTSVHIGECSGAMISAQHYGEMVIPFASKMGRELGPIRMHSCGQSDHLLDAIAQIENLQVLDTGSNTSVAAIREKFGHGFQIDLAPPLEVLMESATSEDMIIWLEQILDENAGGPLQFGYHYEPGYSLENCLLLHDELIRRGLADKGRTQ